MPQITCKISCLSSGAPAAQDRGTGSLAKAGQGLGTRLGHWASFQATFSQFTYSPRECHLSKSTQEVESGWVE